MAVLAFGVGFLVSFVCGGGFVGRGRFFAFFFFELDLAGVLWNEEKMAMRAVPNVFLRNAF